MEAQLFGRGPPIRPRSLERKFEGGAQKGKRKGAQQLLGRGPPIRPNNRATQEPMMGAQLVGRGPPIRPRSRLMGAQPLDRGPPIRMKGAEWGPALPRTTHPTQEPENET